MLVVCIMSALRDLRNAPRAPVHDNRHTHTHTHTDRERDTHTHTDTDKDTQICTQAHTLRQTHRHIYIYPCTYVCIYI